MSDEDYEYNDYDDNNIDQDDAYSEPIDSPCEAYSDPEDDKK